MAEAWEGWEGIEAEVVYITFSRCFAAERNRGARPLSGGRLNASDLYWPRATLSYSFIPSYNCLILLAGQVVRGKNKGLHCLSWFFLTISLTWLHDSLLPYDIRQYPPSAYLKYSVDSFLPNATLRCCPFGAGIKTDLGFTIVILCHKVAEKFTLPKGNLVLGQRKRGRVFFYQFSDTSLFLCVSKA